MPGSGTRTFLEPDYFEANLRQAQIEILVALSPQFKARLTWAELHDLEVLRCEEDFPRVAYVCLSPQLSFVAFPALVSLSAALELRALVPWGSSFFPRRQSFARNLLVVNRPIDT